MVWLQYSDHFEANAKLAVFCAAPAIRNRLPNLFSEIVGTFVLAVFGLAAPEVGRADARANPATS